MSRILFDPANFDEQAHAQLLQNRPAARKRYIIYFTARSGSSWLTDIVSKARLLGRPDECFNPNFIPAMSRAMLAGNLEQYIEALVRRRNTRGVFGCEITFYQMKVVFGGPEAFLKHFGNDKAVWLIREDIVQQAVSLYKMQVTQVAHSAHSDAETRAAAETKFSYDQTQIRYWLDHLLTKEIRTEAMFADFDMTPLRLSYEVITALGAVKVVNVLASYLDEPAIETPDLITDHDKLGTSRNIEFAERFREDEADYMAEVDAKRSAWLARIDQAPKIAVPATKTP